MLLFLRPACPVPQKPDWKSKGKAAKVLKKTLADLPKSSIAQDHFKVLQKWLPTFAQYCIYCSLVGSCPEGLSVLRSILAVPWTELLWTEVYYVVPRICWSHSLDTALGDPINSAVALAFDIFFYHFFQASVFLSLPYSFLMLIPHEIATSITAAFSW